MYNAVQRYNKMYNILFFIMSLTSLFSGAQPFILPRIVKQNMKIILNDKPLGNISNDKICNECKYFISDEKHCKLFYSVDLVNGREYDRAINVRKSNNKCGVDGKYFEQNKVLFLRKLGDIISAWYPLIITGSYVILYVFILNYKYK